MQQLHKPLRILVVGASGLLGAPVTRALLAAGHDVRALARQPARLQARFSTCKAVPGDLQDRASLTAALRDVDAVYLSLSVRPNERESEFHTETDGITNLLAALPGSAVQRISYLSSLVQRYQGSNGFDWWVFRVKQAALQLLAAAPVATTIFYPSNFMESLAVQSTVGRMLLVPGGHQVANHYIASVDYAQQVAAALLRPVDGHEHFVVQGPQAFTQRQAARVFVQHARRRFITVPLPATALRVGQHVSANAAYGRNIIEAVSRYPETFQAVSTWAALGTPTTTLAMFASRY